MWSNNATTQAITVTTSGSYTVTVTDNNSCTASSTATTVNVSNAPAPTINASATIACNGDTVVLTASTSDSYAWSTGETTSAISVTETGEYIVSTTNMCGVSIDTATVNFYFCDIEVPNVFTQSGFR